MAPSLRGSRFLVASAALLLSSCGSSSPRAENVLDGALDGSAPDAKTPQDDAGEAPQGDDASRPDTSDTDAGDVDAGAVSFREQVCGDAATWPAPLPTDTNARKAALVGSKSFGFIEGPVWIADQGVLLFSDMNFNADGSAKGPPAQIWRLEPPASFDSFSPSSNGNGLALSTDGALLAATHDNQGLSRFDLTTAARTPLPVLNDGKHLNSPNDLTVRSDGTVYLTDPDWQLGGRVSETKRTGVYRIAPPLRSSETNQAILVDGTLDKPNGIALSPDEKTLYVGSAGDEIWKYPVQADGSLGTRSKFTDTGASDGLAVDCAGNLYVTAGAAVQVFAASGGKLGEISLPGGAASPSNAAFGGSDRRTLYITAGSRLYSIRLNVPGFPY